MADRFLAEGTAGVLAILVYEQHILVTLHDSLISLAASNPPQTQRMSHLPARIKGKALALWVMFLWPGRKPQATVCTLF